MEYNQESIQESISLSDIFQIKRQKDGNINISVFIKPQVIESLYKKNIYYTQLDNKKVYYEILNDKESLIILDYTNMRLNVINKITKLININKIEKDIPYQKYIGALICSNRRMVSIKQIQSWAIERTPSETFKWYVCRLYYPTLYRKYLAELLKNELLNNDFKTCTDQLGYFSKGATIYYKHLGDNVYVMFGYFCRIKTYDARLAFFTDEKYINREECFLRSIRNSAFELSQDGLTLDFRIDTHYPLLRNIIKEPEKYDFFYNVVSSSERDGIETRKNNTNW